MPLSLHNRFIVRTPMRPVSDAQSLLAGNAVDDTQLLTAFDDPFVQEAIYVASPSLFDAIERWQRGELTGDQRAAARRGLLKYLLRMSTRATPFGLFASCSSGRFDDALRGTLVPEQQLRRRVGIDMAVWCSIIEQLERDPEIRPHLILYPNDMLIAVGGDLRYVEYAHEGDQRARAHRTVAVERNPYLDRILAEAATGATIDRLAAAVADDEVSVDEAAGFVGELLDNQVLRSHLAPALTGPEPIGRLLELLPPSASARERLETLRAAIDRCGQHNGDWRDRHRAIRDAAAALMPDLPASIVTVDAFRPGDVALDAAIRTTILDALTFLHRVSAPPIEKRLEDFARLFRERFEDREIPLLQSLDPDLGVPYGDRPTPPSPLLDGIDMPPREPEQPVSLSATDRWWLHRITETLAAGHAQLDVTNGMAADLPESRQPLPASFAAIFSIVNTGRPTVVFGSAGGATAASMLGRFAALDEGIHAIVADVAAHEQRHAGARLISEVLHMPNDRSGNVMWRPALRPYEIPVLSQAGVDGLQVLQLDDLLLSAPASGRLRLRSRSRDCDVMPLLGHAHRYDLPEMVSVYRLLGDLQGGAALGVPVGRLLETIGRIPRITYQGCVLAPAQWRLAGKDKDAFRALLEGPPTQRVEWQRRHGMPDEVTITEHDHELFVNLANADSRALLAHELKRVDHAVLSECLWAHDPSPWIECDGKGHRVEVIAAVLNAEDR